MLGFAVGSVLTAAALASWSRVQHPLGSSVSKHGTTSAISDYVKHIGDKYSVPGISLVVVHKDDSEWTEDYFGYGVENSRGVAVDKDTRFSVASNSKFFAYHSLGLLIENGTTIPSGEKLSWTTKVKDIVPEWKLQDEYASNHVTIQDLLSHRSGMPRHDVAHQHDQTAAEGIARMRYLRPSYEIREQWQYNNNAYDTIGYIVTLLSGIEYYDFATEYILKPLGLHNTTFNGTEAAESGRLADGYTRHGFNLTQCATAWKDGKKLDKACLGENKSIGWWTKTSGLSNAGAGGIISTAADFAKWIRELYEPKVLPKRNVERASVGVSLVSGETPFPEISVITYSEGQEIYHYRGIKIVTHGGSLPGQASLLIRAPELNLGVMVWNNDDVIGHVINNLIVHTIVDITAGLKPSGFEERVISSLFKEPELPDVPSSPNPPPDESEIVGKYDHGAYGIFDLTRVDENNHMASLVPINVTGPIYLASTNLQFISGVLFTHWSGPVFNWTTALIYPEVKDGKETSKLLATMTKSGSAYLDGTGIGFFSDWWGQGGDKPFVHASEGMEDVPARAEAWFDKLQ